MNKLNILLLSMNLFYLSATEKEDGFVSIFNGKDLSGWVGNKSYYVQADGSLSTKGKGNLITEKEYSDFILRFEVKLASGANNGIGIRVPPSQGRATLECQILDNSAPKYAKLKETQYHGSLYKLVPAKRGFQKPVGEWNTQEISVIGTKVKVTLNGTVILESDMSKLPRQTKGTQRTKGHISLLGHGPGVSFRNFRVKEVK